ncbi:hypothetical protein NDU88_010860 [Pleurodeles waltl]|uniref:Uncharacterized protein n=1 Tax=Pleurodeles waltl TaxID=8319 RepID=A0AAV7PZ52_PLEWA|nr:hypothetical protein NDU88_010860 [Pleurodeles waltl]
MQSNAGTPRRGWCTAGLLENMWRCLLQGHVSQAPKQSNAGTPWRGWCTAGLLENTVEMPSTGSRISGTKAKQRRDALERLVHRRTVREYCGGAFYRVMYLRHQSRAMQGRPGEAGAPQDC